MKSRDLLLEIARCPNIRHCLDDSLEAHPCSAIVLSQSSRSLQDHQVPEPWSGQIERAPVLFVSSNPSISERDEYPRWSASDELITEFFNRRFGGGRKLWIQDGKYALGQDDSYMRAVAFWSAIRNRAIELFQRDIRPGLDYALTEVVHCKSRAEYGVGEALAECTARYLRRVLEFSNAKAIVSLGKRAEAALVHEFGIPGSVNLYGPVTVGRRTRLIAFLPHPNHRGVRTFSKVHTPTELDSLRAFLHSE